MDANRALDFLYHTHTTLRAQLPAIATGLHRLVHGKATDHAAVAPLIGHVTALRCAAEDHFQQEEHYLFPILVECLPEVAGAVNGLLTDHDDMRYLINTLLAALQRIPQEHQAIEEASTCASRYLRLLGDHAEMEEETFFRYAQDHLDPQRLTELGTTLNAARTK
ncbi:MAG: hypothetical protein CO080_04740 [Nitrospirae bacterium CG_4_9_14_0_8_um_filter_70_14]|nr:MAG: hypothetical protein CO080_04740 [Nitrospirae bacterium CG_4_9_14_0_8_um_filter_70_14]